MKRENGTTTITEDDGTTSKVAIYSMARRGLWFYPFAERLAMANNMEGAMIERYGIEQGTANAIVFYQAMIDTERGELTPFGRQTPAELHNGFIADLNENGAPGNASGAEEATRMRNIDLIRESYHRRRRALALCAGWIVHRRCLIHRAAMPPALHVVEKTVSDSTTTARQLYLQPMWRWRRAGLNQTGEQLRHHRGGATLMCWVLITGPQNQHQTLPARDRRQLAADRQQREQERQKQAAEDAEQRRATFAVCIPECA